MKRILFFSLFLSFFSNAFAQSPSLEFYSLIKLKYLSKDLGVKPEIQVFSPHDGTTDKMEGTKLNTGYGTKFFIFTVSKDDPEGKKMLGTFFKKLFPNDACISDFMKGNGDYHHEITRDETGIINESIPVKTTTFISDPFNYAGKNQQCWAVVKVFKDEKKTGL